MLLLLLYHKYRTTSIDVLRYYKHTYFISKHIFEIVLLSIGFGMQLLVRYEKDIYIAQLNNTVTEKNEIHGAYSIKRCETDANTAYNILLDAITDNPFDVVFTVNNILGTG